MAGTDARSREWLWRALLESALIVLGVVLGFLVNEWREAAEERAASRHALERVAEELQTNRAIVANIAPYHAEVRDKLRALTPEQRDQPLIETLREISTEGVGDLILHREAWEIAMSRDALSHQDFELVQEIASLYAVSELGAEQTFAGILDQFRSRDAYTATVSAPLVMRLGSFYTELVAQEEFLLRRYDAALTHIEEETGITPEGQTMGDRP